MQPYGTVPSLYSVSGPPRVPPLNSVGDSVIDVAGCGCGVPEPRRRRVAGFFDALLSPTAFARMEVEKFPDPVRESIFTAVERAQARMAEKPAATPPIVRPAPVTVTPDAAAAVRPAPAAITPVPLPGWEIWNLKSAALPPWQRQPDLYEVYPSMSASHVYYRERPRLASAVTPAPAARRARRPAPRGPRVRQLATPAQPVRLTRGWDGWLPPPSAIETAQGYW